MCVICDEHIIGVEPVLWLKKETILQHQIRLSVQGYEEHLHCSLQNDLVQHYQLDDTDFKGLLLSRRAQKQDDSYTCCKSCKLSLRKGREKNPLLSMQYQMALQLAQYQTLL